MVRPHFKAYDASPYVASEALDYSARPVIMVWRYGIMTLRALWLTNTET
jgi:hypothetical protein